MIFGISENIVKAVSSFFSDIKKYFLYLLPIGAGAIIGIIGFSRILKYLLRVFPMQTTFTFADLIIGTLPVLFRRADKKGFKKMLDKHSVLSRRLYLILPDQQV